MGKSRTWSDEGGGGGYGSAGSRGGNTNTAFSNAYGDDTLNHMHGGSSGGGGRHEGGGAILRNSGLHFLSTSSSPSLTDHFKMQAFLKQNFVFFSSLVVVLAVVRGAGGQIRRDAKKMKGSRVRSPCPIKKRRRKFKDQ